MRKRGIDQSPTTKMGVGAPQPSAQKKARTDNIEFKALLKAGMTFSPKFIPVKQNESENAPHTQNRLAQTDFCEDMNLDKAPKEQNKTTITPTLLDLLRKALSKPSGYVYYHNEAREKISVHYPEVLRRVEQLASDLIKKYKVSYIKETMVGLCCSRSIDQIVATFAILCAGGTLVPLEHDPKDIARTHYKLTTTKLNLVITDDQVDSTQIPRRMAGGKIIRRITVNKNPRPNSKQTKAAGIALPEIPGDTRAYIQFTSGTTGKAKGVEIEHGSLINLWHAEGDLLDEGVTAGFISEAEREKDAGIVISPITFDAYFEELFKSIQTNATHIMCAAHRIIPTELARVIKDNEITTATMLANLLARIDPESLKSLRDLISMGAPPKENLLDELNEFIAIVRNEWGVTEATVRNTNNPNNHATIGRPIRGCHMITVDPETDKLADKGEILIRDTDDGRCLARGYFGDPEKTNAKFPTLTIEGKPQRYYRTGDRGNLNADGTITFAGRIDREIKISGVRVNLEGIEQQIEACNSVVRTCAIKAYKLSPTSDTYRMIAYVELQDGVTNDSAFATIKAHLQSSELLEIAHPRQFVFAPIPRMSNGKLNYTALQEPKAAARVSIPPKDAIQEQLMKLWQQTLTNTVEFGIKQNFHELGGDSLSLAALCVHINILFKLEPKNMVNPQIMFECPTIESQALMIEARIKDCQSLAFHSRQKTCPTPVGPVDLFLPFFNVGGAPDIAAPFKDTTMAEPMTFNHSQ